MDKIAMIAAGIGLAGLAATYFGIINIMPLTNWCVLAVVGVVAVIITRRAGD